MAKTQKEKAEAKVKAEAEAEAKKGADSPKAALIEEAKLLGIKLPRTSIAGFKGKKPEDIEKEKARIAKGLIKWLQIMIAKKKAEAKMKPIDKRKAVLVGRFKAVRSRDRAHTYSDANIKAWTEEFNLIKNNPRAWNKITKNGTVPYVPGNKKKKTAKEILDGMNLDDES